VLVAKDLTKICDRDMLLMCVSSILKNSQSTELLLLFAVYFHTNRVVEIVDLVRSTLGFPVSVRILTNAKLRIT
jgi:hypothetical protein